MSKVAGSPPHVTGISPNEGTPGTKLTIRGENFGQIASDLTHIFINQIDVGPSAQWFSSRRITAITPLGEGELEIVVVTNNDKFGTASVSYHQTAKRNVGPQTSVTYWPADERRYCPAIYEHSHAAGGPASGSSAPGMAGGELDPSTGLPMSEMTRLSIPLSESALRAIYPVNGSVQLTDKDFDPLMFLLKFYKGSSSTILLFLLPLSSFNDLTVTFNNFRKSMRVEGLGEPVNVIRTNLVLIFRCLDGMDSLRARLVAEKQTGSGGQFQLPFESSLSESRNLGHSLFEGILKRRDRTDSIRNAIAVLQRYQFLFNLPHAIRMNISKGDYSLVLNDYLRAKSLFANSDVSVLRHVYGDVEKVMDSFRTLLYNQLCTMPIEFEEAKRKIGYLIQLEVPYQPAWVCLTRFKEWLVEQVHAYQQAYRRTIGIQPNPGPTVTSSQSDTGRNVKDSGTMDWLDEIVASDLPPLVYLVKSICQLLVHHVTQFWRLGASYSSGQLSMPDRVVQLSNATPHGRRQKNSPVATAVPVDPSLPANPVDPQTAWANINLEMVHVLSCVIRDEVLEAVGIGNKDATFTEWLPQCIQEFRRACNTLPLNELPSEIGDIFSRLAHDLRRHSVRGIFQFAQSSIEALQLKETWHTDANDAEGGTTLLPALYEELISQALQRCQEQVTCHTSVEKPLFESAELQGRFPDWCADAMVAFISALRHLADRIESTIPQCGPDEEGGSHSAWLNADSICTRQSAQTPILSQARGLLLVLNNANWVHCRANQRLLAAYEAADYASPKRLRQRLDDTWSKGMSDLASRYVKLRGSWLCAPVGPFLKSFADRVKDIPDRQVPISGAHTFVRTVIANLSHIFSELVLLFGTEELVNRRQSDQKPNGIRSILTQIVTMLVDQFRTSCSEIKPLSLPHSAQLQLALDFQTLRRLVPKALFAPDTAEQLNRLCQLSDNVLDRQEKQYLDKCVDKEKARLRLLIDGLGAVDSAPSVIVIRG
ncbi:Exocyst complex component 2 [Paragonimus heterotremus]|uniref:Exocyst complex component 2 n=1 Tax=Paragonimus heterotremus TaxID=100268 RepID=A0A8J4TH46_9TREM|nr:Exocyst complex component 2 [Paragonimus heterotremus]